MSILSIRIPAFRAAVTIGITGRAGRSCPCLQNIHQEECYPIRFLIIIFNNVTIPVNILNDGHICRVTSPRLRQLHHTSVSSRAMSIRITVVSGHSSTGTSRNTYLYRGPRISNSFTSADWSLTTAPARTRCCCFPDGRQDVSV